MRSPLSYRSSRRNIVRADKEAGGVRVWPLMGHYARTYHVARYEAVLDPEFKATIPKFELPIWHQMPKHWCPPGFVRTLHDVARQTVIHATLAAGLTAKA